MKLLMSILLMFCPMSATYPVDTILSVVTNYAYMYKTADLSSEKFDFQIKHGETVIVLNQALDNDFYYVDYKGSSGYVYKECLSKVEEGQDVMLSYNAKTEVKTTVYFLGSDGKVDTTPSADSLVIEENTELYLYEGFDRKAEFNAVKFSHNGKIVLGYVKTQDIVPYGVSNILIISITAIFACVGVIMILLGISKKKTKKMPVPEFQKNDEKDK